MKKNHDNGIEFKYVELEQYDHYDEDLMVKNQHRYDKRIGSLMIAFNELEKTVERGISFLVSDRSDDNGMRIIIDYSFRQKLILFQRLATVYLHYAKGKKDTKEIVRLKALLKLLLSAAEIRNIIAHAKWMSLDEDGFVRSNKSSLSDEAWVRFKYYKLTPKILYNLERQILKVNTSLYYFLDRNNLA